jgi:hypothetical protein
MTSNNETVHVSFGNTANHITSHLLNLQGLAATTTGGGDESVFSESLCDPSVTHDITSADSDYYASATTSTTRNNSGRYMYVPRALIIDGRDSFGVAWGSNNKNNYSSSGGGGGTAMSSESCAAWNGKVSLFDVSNRNDAMFVAGTQNNDQQNIITATVDPLDNFRNSASVIGLSPQFSRFNAEPPSSYNSGLYNSSNRHVQWDDLEEEEEDDDDDYCYGRQEDRQRMIELKRRQLESKNEEMKSGFNDIMATAWEEAFYGQQQPQQQSNHQSLASNDKNETAASSTAAPAPSTSSSPPDTSSSPNTTNNNKNTAASERTIYWHDYFMPPRPQPSKYQVLLPFDTDTILSSSSSSTHGSTNNNNNNSNNTWSSSFATGYRPGSGGGYISQSWRENVLSEALRKVLEGCDIVKGFNLMVDGGNYHGSGGGGGGDDQDDASSGGGGANKKYAKQLTQIVAGGTFYSGLATSFLEELQEECKSAGRLSILVDPTIVSTTNNNSNSSSDNEINRVETFRRRLNAGLALHGLSTNSDAFLPVSIDGAHRALYGHDNRRRTTTSSSSQNRKLFEGSAAIAFALESSTLFYRLRRRDKQPSSNHEHGRRSRLGIQSGFYQGYSGNNGYDDDANDPFATASTLTYHEFLACARPSSDRRRSILEMDALLRPLSRPSTGGVGAGGGGGGGGVDIASLLARNGSAMSQELLQLSLAGIIGGNISQDHFGELHERMMRGTTIEEMRLEQDRRRSRGRSSSSRSKGPGEWMEDISTNAAGGGGILSSLSGNEIAFGRRTDHHHFALLTSLRPSATESRRCNSAKSSGSTGIASAYLRPMMESMGMKYRPEVSSGLVVRDSVAQLTGVGSYWGSVFAERFPSAATGGKSTTTQQQSETAKLSPTEIANNTPILSILGNSTRSYPRLNFISTGFVDALHSRSNKGYFSRDVMSGLIPEKDDCEEALEYCRELVDVYEPPMGSGLVVGEDENDDVDAYFDEDA